MINIPMQIELDTSSAQQQFSSLVGNISSSPIVSESKTPAITGDSSIGSMGILSQQMNTIPQRLSEIVDYIRKISESTDKMKSVLVNQFDKNDDLNLKPAGKGSTVPEWVRNDKSLIAGARDVSNEINTALRGDVGGLAVYGLNDIGNAAFNGSAALAKNGATTSSKLLSGIGIGAIVAALAAGTIKQIEGNYEDALPGIDSVLSIFGGDNINSRSAVTNSNYGLSLWTDLVGKNRGTGLSNDEFVSLVGNLGAYGINDISRAGDIAAQSAKWSRYTGVDSGSALSFAGMIERYGGNGTDALSSAYAASRASGLEKNQFGEFLNGLQSVIENGISRGFVKSADDVASQLTLLANLSGNSDLWKGQQGADRYNTMVSSLAQNTSLSTSSSLLLYKAVQNTTGDNSWVDVLSAMESGNIDESFLSNLRGTVSGAYGGDRESMVSAYKDIFGLNWTGASQIYDMLENLDSGNFKKSEFENITTNPEFKSDTTRIADSVSEMNKMLVNIGQGSAELKIMGLDSINNTVNGIFGSLVEDNYVDMIDSAISGMFGKSESKEKNAFIDNLKSMLKNPKTRMGAIEIIDALSSMDEGQRYAIDQSDMLNSGEIDIENLNNIKGIYIPTANTAIKSKFSAYEGRIPEITELYSGASSEEMKMINFLLASESGAKLLSGAVNYKNPGRTLYGYGGTKVPLEIDYNALRDAFFSALNSSSITITDETQRMSGNQM